MQAKPLFSNARYCKNCGKILFEDYARDLCSVCETQLIFDDVREYIRSEEVNEYDVAKHFDIPVGMVQQWIKEGRTEYKERGAKTVMSSFCQRCGAKVTFGTLCQKCLKELNNQHKGYAVKGVPTEESQGRLRYLETVDDYTEQ